MIYKIFKDVTNIKRRRKRPYFLAAYLLQTFLNTGSIDETFKQSYFKHILRGSANVYEVQIKSYGTLWLEYTQSQMQ